jgi:hypothetical protein
MRLGSRIQTERHGTYLNAGLEYPARHALLVLVRYARYEQHSGGEYKVGAPDDENCTREAKGPVRRVNLDYRKEETAKAGCDRSKCFYCRRVSGRVGACSTWTHIGGISQEPAPRLFLPQSKGRILLCSLAGASPSSPMVYNSFSLVNFQG